MKKILGIDVGTTSTSINLIAEDVEKQNIVSLESEVLLFPFKNPKDKSKHSKGSSNFKSDNSKRTDFRGNRKSRKNKKSVYKEVVKFLEKEFDSKKENKNLDVNKLKIEGQERILNVEELCAVIFNFTKYRGFNFFVEEEKTDYKKDANEVINWCEANNKTVTHFFYDNDIPFHTSRTVINKKGEKVQKNPPPIHEDLHRDELISILNKQKEKYEQFSSEEKIKKLFKLIYFKKPIPSQKHLVSDCKMENGKTCVSTSNPFFQKLRILQTLHDIRLTGVDKSFAKLTQDEVLHLYEMLLEKDVLTGEEIIEIIGRGKKVNFKEVKGSNTIASIKKELPTITENELYDVWQKIYSHKNPNHIVSALIKYNISEDISKRLSSINLERTYYSSYSEKAIKKLIPYMNGDEAFYDLYNAKDIVYGDYLGKPLEKKKKLENINKNELRNPVVEKAWNQIVSMLNSIIEKHIEIDEVRVELSRDLKLSKKVRKKINRQILENTKRNNLIKLFLLDNGVKTSFNNKKRISLWMEQGGEINKKTLQVKSNAIDLYSGKEINTKQALNQSVTNLEHTLCQSRFMDDSLKYMTLTFDDFNKNVKKNRTAFEVVSEDFSEKEKKAFFKRVKDIYKSDKNKQKTFEYGYDDFPEAIPSNQQTLTSYIAKKYVEKLTEVFDNVFVTNGKVTKWIRDESGVSEAFKNLIFKNHPEVFEPKKSDKPDKSQWEKEGKRVDHRHHAMDSFIIAITKQSYIEKLNNLNSSYRESVDKDQKLFNNVKKSILRDIWGRFGEDNIVDVVIDTIESTIVKVKKSSHPIIDRNGCKGFRGPIHRESPLKQTKTVEVFKEDKFNSKITIENIYSENIKNLIKEFDNIEQAFLENSYLSKLENLKIHIDTSNKIKINNNVFDSRNNHKIDIFKNGDNFKGKTVSAYELINGYEPEEEPYMSLHKKDYVIVGLTKNQVDKAISSGNMKKISKHLYYVAKISGDGIIFMQRHYFNSDTIKHVRGSANSIHKKNINRIVKMKILNNGNIVRYQKINRKKAEKV